MRSSQGLAQLLYRILVAHHPNPVFAGLTRKSRISQIFSISSDGALQKTRFELTMLSLRLQVFAQNK